MRHVRTLTLAEPDRSRSSRASPPRSFRSRPRRRRAGSGAKIACPLLPGSAREREPGVGSFAVAAVTSASVDARHGVERRRRRAGAQPPRPTSRSSRRSRSRRRRRASVASFWRPCDDYPRRLPATPDRGRAVPALLREDRVVDARLHARVVGRSATRPRREATS